ncbi:acyltransferase family protein [Rhodoferax sp.]|uniref:acyltransferase family protein n=1 Tax=Rhodoferax sp. TaxID=50421 RepID=UPI00273185C3|nr:acyltransferase [Rhodoferax sp.]MDP2440552.1 acyltransferase [Rhodoferax sp.]MDZ4208671.1 acyltransferase [Rhodoferax sp.]
MKPRIEFCDTLRGLAAVIVMLAHYTHGFNAIGGWLYNPAGGQAYPVWFLEIFKIDGAFGVAVFFLVSGFVIPMSLTNRTAGVFLAARAIRLYPTYIVCSAISLALVIGFNIEPVNKITFLKAFNSMTFFRDWLGGLPFDSIIWSLEIEVKFYLYAALMLPLMKTRPLTIALVPVFATGALLLCGVRPMYPIAGILQPDILNTLLWNIGYLSFISVGMLFYSLHNGMIGLRTTLASMTFALTVASQFLLANYGNAGVVRIYLGAFLTFTVFYTLFRRRSWTATAFLSKVRYPLYVVHATAGYILLSILVYRVGMPALLALPVVVTFVLLLAYAIHQVIEAPSIRLSSARLAAMS